MRCGVVRERSWDLAHAGGPRMSQEIPLRLQEVAAIARIVEIAFQHKVGPLRQPDAEDLIVLAADQTLHVERRLQTRQGAKPFGESARLLAHPSNAREIDAQLRWRSKRDLPQRSSGSNSSALAPA